MILMGVDRLNQREGADRVDAPMPTGRWIMVMPPSAQFLFMEPMGYGASSLSDYLRMAPRTTAAVGTESMVALPAYSTETPDNWWRN